jgi:hypothetical protein
MLLLLLLCLSGRPGQDVRPEAGDNRPTAGNHPLPQQEHVGGGTGEPDCDTEPEIGVKERMVPFLQKKRNIHFIKKQQRTNLNNFVRKASSER